MKDTFFKKEEYSPTISGKSGGYTIIETMISIALFIIIVMVGMEALLNANLLNNKSQNMRSIMDNMSFVMEDVSRNLRTGYDFYCLSGSDTVPAPGATKSGSNCWGIAFEPSTGGSEWVYEVVSQVVNTNTTSYIRKSTDGGATWVQLTPNQISINTTLSGFTVIGAEPPSQNDTGQPFVTIRMIGQMQYQNVNTPFYLQTSVSQRQIDI